MFEFIDDADLVDLIGVTARAQSIAVARQLALIGELDRRRPFETATRLYAALDVSRPQADAMVLQARALRDRLPAVAALFATGAVDHRMVAMIIARTGAVDSATLRGLDTAIARKAHRWMRLSEAEAQDRLDFWIARFDPVEDRRYPDAEPSHRGLAGVSAAP